ncbi:MAG TPA: hypothetical protein VIK19_02145 [Syntrophales bacterium]|jgi:hypothetical protein
MKKAGINVIPAIPFWDSLANLRETIALLLDPESPTPLRPKDKSRMLS